MCGKPLADSAILNRFEPVPPTGCWLYTGAWDGEGYGIVSRNRRRIRAHRFFYEKLVSPIPTGLILCHRCDTPACVNPDHLYPGTHESNSLDAHARKRHPWSVSYTVRAIERFNGAYQGGWKRGRQNVNAKLTDEQVREIRRHPDPFPYAIYRKRFHVARSTLYYVRTGQRRKVLA
jgi:hypothetical protein